MGQVIRSTAGPHAALTHAAPPQQTTLDRLMPYLVALIPLAMALLLVPGRTLAASACPPSGEGLVACQIYKGWAPYITSVCLVWVGLYILGQILFIGVPRVIAHVRAGDRLRRQAKLPVVATHADPALAAAVWGQSTRATPATKVMSGFAWSQAANRSERVTATPQLLASAVTPTVHATAEPPRVPFRPVAIQGGISLHVCGECLTVVEGDSGAAEVACPSCGTVTHRQPRVRPATPARQSAPSPAATRVILLAAGLDGRSIGRLEEAIVRRPGEPRRVVVLQLPAGEQAGPGSLRALERCAASASGAGGEIIVVAPAEKVRASIAGLGLAVAASTSQAMELASSTDTARRPALTAVPAPSDRLALG